jgi:hypothetical protein
MYFGVHIRIVGSESRSCASGFVRGIHLCGKLEIASLRVAECGTEAVEV